MIGPQSHEHPLSHSLCYISILKASQGKEGGTCYGEASMCQDSHEEHDYTARDDWICCRNSQWKDIQSS